LDAAEVSACSAGRRGSVDAPFVLDFVVEALAGSSKLGDEPGELVCGGSEEDAEVDRRIAVHDPVPEEYRLAPGNLGMGLLHVVRELAGRLAKHREVLQQGVAPQPITSELVDGGSAFRERDDLIASVDRFVEQQPVTLLTAGAPVEYGCT